MSLSVQNLRKGFLSKHSIEMTISIIFIFTCTCVSGLDSMERLESSSKLNYMILGPLLVLALSVRLLYSYKKMHQNRIFSIFTHQFNCHKIMKHNGTKELLYHHNWASGPIRLLVLFCVYPVSFSFWLLVAIEMLMSRALNLQSSRGLQVIFKPTLSSLHRASRESAQCSSSRVLKEHCNQSHAVGF